MKFEIMQMISFMNKERPIIYLLSVIAKIKKILIRHEDMCPLWPDATHLLYQQQRKGLYTFLIINIIISGKSILSSGLLECCLMLSLEAIANNTTFVPSIHLHKSR